MFILLMNHLRHKTYSALDLIGESHEEWAS